jgi:ankyrin repeat protein
VTHAARASASPVMTKVVGFIFMLAVLLGGLYLGTESSLHLQREASGSVTAVNAWRSAGRFALLTRSVTGLRVAKMQEVDLSERERRSTAHRDVFGRLEVPEELLLIGDTQIAYPYHEDLSLIRAFINNPRNAEALLTHPVDIRRTVASWVLLAIAFLGIVGWIVKLATGRDPLAGAPAKVKPLPPAVGAAVFLGAVAFLGWFLFAGHLVFGPVATSKVRLLMNSARQNNAAGIQQAAARGVYVDVRDEQGMTALMLAARADAALAVDALLGAGANPNLRDNSDNTALMSALQMRKAASAARLLAAAFDVDAADSNGRTALHLAAERGEAVYVRRLLQAGANANQPDTHGWTPIFFAAASGDPETVAALLQAGADPSRQLPDRRRPSDLAQTDAVRSLLAGAAR